MTGPLDKQTIHVEIAHAIPPTAEELAKRVRRLDIKHETLVNYVAASAGTAFAPPMGRIDYDAMVKAALEKAGLSE